MRAIIQRVNSAVLTVDNQTISSIGRGFLVTVGITKNDDIKSMEKLAYRLATLRLFRDENDRLNKNITDVNGELLIVSNFTLCSTNKGGTRPDFSDSADKEKALYLYNALIDMMLEKNIPTKSGVFGAHMHISTDLDGPVTLRLDS